MTTTPVEITPRPETGQLVFKPARRGKPPLHLVAVPSLDGDSCPVHLVDKPRGKGAAGLGTKPGPRVPWNQAAERRPLVPGSPKAQVGREANGCTFPQK